jgi:DMSO/TMAO reductase YedYZ molybdopterin-dependent catalytic subunit
MLATEDIGDVNSTVLDQGSPKGWNLFYFGAAAGAVAVVASLLVRLIFNGIYLPEIASDAVFSLVPGFLESRAVESLGTLAKYTTFTLSSVLNVVVLALIPVLYLRWRKKSKMGASVFAILAVLSYMVMFGLGVVFLSLTQVSSQQVGVIALGTSLLVPSIVFAGFLGAIHPKFTPHQPVLMPTERPNSGFSRRRRLFIKSAVGAVAAATLLYYGVEALFSGQPPTTVGDEASRILASQVTPNYQFYRVDINVFPPSIDAKSWNLNLHGLVNTPEVLSYEQVTGMPAAEEYATLECVSNNVGGNLMSTALWKGIRLKDLLNAAGIAAGADYVVFKCYDGYTVGIPLERAIEEGAILAYEMNGVPLPTEHGFPVRAIIPGLYGMMNAKWITEIELVKGAYDGFWQQRGWTNVATYQTGSTIITPGDSPLRGRFALPSGLTNVTGDSIPIVGAAFAGDRGIQKVEVSTDGGDTWQVASLQDPLSQYTWVFWRLDWNPSLSRSYTLLVRATDGRGQVQIATMTDPFPDGATGYDVVDIKVSNG